MAWKYTTDTQDYHSFADDPVGAYGTSASLFARIKSPSWASTLQILNAKYNTNYGLAIVHQSGSMRALFGTASGPYPIDSATPPTNQWFTVFMQWLAGTGAQLWRDNVSQGTAGSTANFQEQLRQVSFGYGASSIGIVATWNVGNLTADERLALHNGVDPEFIRPQSLTRVWDFRYEVAPIERKIGIAATITGSPVYEAQPTPHFDPYFPGEVGFEVPPPPPPGLVGGQAAVEWFLHYRLKGRFSGRIR